MLEYKYRNKNVREIVLDVVSTLLVNMIVIIMATKIFKNISVDSVFYTFLVSLLLLIMNKSVKPILKVIMLPLNFYTLGLSYPLTNIIILKIIGYILKPHFILSGWFSAFFISIFISIMTIVIDYFIGNNIRKG